LDEALARLASTGPEYAGGLSNHGPMACEALLRLGRADAIGPWLDAYLPHLEEAPGHGRPLASDEWEGALGAAGRYPDWVALFEQEMSARPWADAVAAWVPRLVPGSIAAGTHGLIRAAHATRALAEAETPQRRCELAAGLAYWAAEYRALQGAPAPSGALTVSQALIGAPTLPVGERGRGVISEVAAKASQMDGFAASVDALGPPTSVDGALSELTSSMAGWYLANCEHDPVPFVHGVTAPAALRLLLPYLPAGATGTAFAYVWQACAAIRSAFAVERPCVDVGVEPPSGEQLGERAVEVGGAHAIKLTEACLRENALRADPAYLFAAADAGRRLAI
jgi:hypothetical protein